MRYEDAPGHVSADFQEVVDVFLTDVRVFHDML